MARREIAKVNGFVHDITKVASLSTQPSNLRVLSDSTLYILQNLSGEDVTFLSRYGTILTGGFYDPVVSGTGQAETVEEAIDIIRKDLNDMAIEDLLECICNQLQVIAGGVSSMSANDCGCVVGQGSDNEDGERGGDVPSDIGDIEYEEPAAVQDRDCKAANLVHKTLLDIFVELDSYNVDDMSVFALALVISIVTGVYASVVATPLVGIVVAVAGAVATFAARLVGLTVVLSDIVTALDDEGEELVCILLDSQSVSEAKSDYLAALTTAGLTTNETTLVGLLMTNALLNILFFDTAETAAYWPTFSGEYDCSACETASAQWEFSEHNGQAAGTGDLTMDGSSRVLTAVETTSGYWRLWIVIPDAYDIVPVQVNREVEYISNSGFVPWPTSINYGECIDSGDAYPDVYNHSSTGNPPPTGEMAGCNFNMSCNVPFTATWKLYGGIPEGPC